MRKRREKREGEKGGKVVTKRKSAKNWPSRVAKGEKEPSIFCHERGEGERKRQQCLILSLSLGKKKKKNRGDPILLPARKKVFPRGRRENKGEKGKEVLFWVDQEEKVGNKETHFGPIREKGLISEKKGRISQIPPVEKGGRGSGASVGESLKRKKCSRRKRGRRVL